MTRKTNMTTNPQKISGSQMRLLKEAQNLLDRSRAVLETLANNETLKSATKTKAAEKPKQQSKSTQQNTKIKVQKETRKVATELTPQRTAELYQKGMSVNEIAVKENVTYSKVRKLLTDSGTPIRDASSRLKGRTRKSAS